MKIVLSSLLLFFFITTAFSQNKFKEGFIVKASGDTIYGEIDSRGDLKMGKLCKFRVDKKSEIELFTPADLNSYRFIDGKYYVSKVVGVEIMFMQCLLSGVVNVYYIRTDVGDKFYMENEKGELAEVPYDEEILEKNGRLYKYRTTRHVGILKYYFPGSEKLSEEIDDVKKVEYRTLVKLAEKYHKEVCDDNMCITYERQIPLLQIAVEPFVGTRFYRNNFNVTEYGVDVAIAAPRSSERLSFITGYRLDQFSQNNRVLEFNRIPIFVEYKVHDVAFSPKMALGYQAVFSKSGSEYIILHTVCLNGGVDVSLTKRVSIFGGVEYEYEPAEASLLPSSTFDFLMGTTFMVRAGISIKLY